MTHALVVTPTGASPCPPRFLTRKAACSAVWVRAELEGARERPGTNPARCPLLGSLAVRNPYTGSTFLLAALPASLLLLQWYEPLQKFLLLKVWGGAGEAKGTLGWVAGDLGRRNGDLSTPSAPRTSPAPCPALQGCWSHWCWTGRSYRRCAWGPRAPRDLAAASCSTSCPWRPA